ncbi:MAG: helix-turn-helix domain-containing protein, partial [Alphaproteobacteria bacterium]|nr:helix-turn-helix domain-containing protein [Alphaproteobacteria bacterium]
MGLKPAPEPKKTPRQSRSAATFEAIIEAGARILREGGYEALTTNRVADLAGVSVGSLYQYFPNKEAILVEMVCRHLTDLGAGIATIASRADE